MPRLRDSRSWSILQHVPANCFRLVKEVLSLRQKIVALRQTTHFLRRCLQYGLMPNFIANKQLYERCGMPKDSRRIHAIERQLLRTALKTKRDQMYSCLEKCAAKERCCERIVPTRLWQRIVGESKSICDSVRSRAKTRLIGKFDRLVDQQRYRRSREVATGNLTNETIPQVSNGSEQLPKSRVTVISDIRLSEGARSLLELGPSFSPSQNITHKIVRKIVGNLQLLHERLRAKANAERRGTSTTDRSNDRIPALPFPCTFYKPQEGDPVMDTKFCLFATSVYRVVQQYADKRTSSNITLSQRQGMKEIRDLLNNGTLRLSVSDKGGEFVALPQGLDRAITGLHLEDDTLYCRSTEKEFCKQYRKLNRVWSSVGRRAGLSNTTINRIRCDLPICPVLYVLVKTHKLSHSELCSGDPGVFKVRPIISNIGGPTDKISWFLNIILRQLLQYIPAHLTNTSMLLNKLSSANLTDGCVVESFDVTSLYTNVSNEDALEATHELLCEHEGTLNLLGFTISQVMEILGECLKCSMFRWNGQYYRQLRGLAMGQRLAPVLAIAFMSRIEKPILDRRPLLYYSYIDDCLIICHTQGEIDKCFDLLNEQSVNIKFTRETPIENWLPFLNIQIQLRGDTVRTKWYRKPSNKNILVHCDSAHPKMTKRAIVNNMYRTASKVSSDVRLEKESLEIARSIAVSNGYKESGSTRRGYAEHRRFTNGISSDKVPFSFPFVSEEVSRMIRASLQKCGLQDVVRLVEIPPNNLKRILVRNRLYDQLCDTPACMVCPHGRAGDCMKSGVIYLIRCLACNGEYIGETGRPLRVRVKEHLDGLRRSRIQTPLGGHRVHCHDDVEFQVTVSILAQEPEIAARKTLEAFWISARDPQMNRKEECVAITRELAPFSDLCGF